MATLSDCKHTCGGSGCISAATSCDASSVNTSSSSFALGSSVLKNEPFENHSGDVSPVAP